MTDWLHRELPKICFWIAVAAWLTPALSFLFVGWDRLIGFAIAFVIAIVGMVVGFVSLKRDKNSKLAAGGVALSFAYIVAMIGVTLSDKLAAQ